MNNFFLTCIALFHILSFFRKNNMISALCIASIRKFFSKCSLGRSLILFLRLSQAETYFILPVRLLLLEICRSFVVFLLLFTVFYFLVILKYLVLLSNEPVCFPLAVTKDETRAVTIKRRLRLLLIEFLLNMSIIRG